LALGFFLPLLDFWRLADEILDPLAPGQNFTHPWKVLGVEDSPGTSDAWDFRMNLAVWQGETDFLANPNLTLGALFLLAWLTGGRLAVRAFSAKSPALVFAPWPVH